jgi:hypothetical protein
MSPYATELAPRILRYQEKDNPTSIRRHVAFPSRQLSQVPGSLVVCPCRNVLGRVAANPFGLTVYLLQHYAAIQPHGPSRPLPAAQIRLMDQPSLSAGRSVIFGKHIFMLLLKDF